MAPDEVRTGAHAKVNVFLRILAAEQTGFHQIETVFALLELADELVVRRTAHGVALEVDGPDLGPTDKNLAVRAAHAVLAATGQKFGVSIELTKRIPARAGLGGGSSDAAAALHAVNVLAGGAVPKAELLQFAVRLGSDVPFFASGAALALAWGRGERLLRLEAPPAAPVLVVVPGFGVATPDAYRWWDEMQSETPTRGAVALDLAAISSWGSLGRLGKRFRTGRVRATRGVAHAFWPSRGDASDLGAPVRVRKRDRRTICQHVRARRSSGGTRRTPLHAASH